MYKTTLRILETHTLSLQYQHDMKYHMKLTNVGDLEM